MKLQKRGPNTYVMGHDIFRTTIKVLPDRFRIRTGIAIGIHERASFTITDDVVVIDRKTGAVQTPKQNTNTLCYKMVMQDAGDFLQVKFYLSRGDNHITSDQLYKILTRLEG